MNTRSIEVRKQFLNLDLGRLNEYINERRAANASPDELRALAIELCKIHGRVMECDSWLKVREKDPGFGEMVIVDGVPVPRLPTFGDPAKVHRALEDPAGALECAPDQDLTAAREYRSGRDAMNMATMMDGANPDAPRKA